MKTSSVIHASPIRTKLGITFGIALASALALNSASAADQTAEKAPAKNKPAPVSVPATKKTLAKKTTATNQVQRTEAKTLVTGSLIPRKVSRKGGIVDTPQNVYIIDRGEIERYGASTTADALRRLPGVTTTGR